MEQLMITSETVLAFVHTFLPILSVTRLAVLNFANTFIPPGHANAATVSCYG